MEIKDLEFDKDFFAKLTGETVQEDIAEEQTELPVDLPDNKTEESQFLTNDLLSQLTGEEVAPEEEKQIVSAVEETQAVNTEQEDKDTFYKSRIEYAKSIGRLPEDFELEDEVVLDDEKYQQILDYENQYVYDVISSQVRQEYTEKLGDNIVKFVEAGGDYTKIAELIKEQNKVVEFNISTDSGQKAIVSKYYKEVLKWSDARVEKHVDRLFNDGDLEEEATTLKTEFDTHFQEQQNQLVEQQVKEQQKQVAQQQKQIEGFSSTMLESGYTQKEIDQYVNYVYKNIEIKEGISMPALDLKILKIQRDPKQLLELIQFVEDKENYLKKKAIEINNPKVDKTFATIVKNKTVKTITEASPNKKQAVGEFKFNFK